MIKENINESTYMHDRMRIMRYLIERIPRCSASGFIQFPSPLAGDDYGVGVL